MSKNDINDLFEISKKIVCLALIFFLPLFFLTTTQEFFVTNKLYLLAFAVLLLLLISTLQLLISKKFIWTKRPFDYLVLLFLAAITVSTVFSSPNKIQALLNPNFGLVMMVSLAILYFYLSHNSSYLSSKIYHLESIILSIITIVFFFQPFKNISLPQNFAFLNNPGFTPVGSQFDLAIFLGFFVIMAIIKILIKNDQTSPLHSMVYHLGAITFLLLALFLTAYSLLKPIQPVQLIQLGLPPFRLSWYAALEILKNPLTAIIGAGLDNFSSVFTRIKDFAYNQSPLWQINTFSVSRSAILQILTETGIFGILSFGLLVFSVFKLAMKQLNNETMKQFVLVFVYLIICLLIFPSSLIVWFLFFISIAQLSTIYRQSSSIDRREVDLSDLIPVYLGITIVSFLIIAGAGYFLGRYYASEYYFKKSMDAITKNNLKEVYENQRQAIILNPYIDRYHSGFAQTNLIIANNVSSRIKDNKLSEQDRQTITQAIQAAIAEGKAVVSLNPQRADGWQNLASIYLNVINTAKDADVWTISAYQRAIIADPQNPTYRVGLGGVYYSLKKYDDALKFFEQAISLKPDWPDASYNFAWTHFQKKNYPQAVNAMQNTLSLLDPTLDKADYEKVKKELEEFKKMIPEEEASPDVK